MSSPSVGTKKDPTTPSDDNNPTIITKKRKTVDLDGTSGSNNAHPGSSIVSATMKRNSVKEGEDDNKPDKNKKTKTTICPPCPYLDTIERSMLDFDFEASCSVSLECGPQNIYGCLVCGKYFRGRGSKTPAYIHSVDVGHFVFVHLWNGKFYCLPDNYEIRNQEDIMSLKDISEALHPTFASQEIAKLDTNSTLCRDLFGRRYLPGFVGLNNLNKTDYINATVQALAHVQPLRDFFLNYDTNTVTTNNNNSNINPQPTTTTNTNDNNNNNNNSTRKLLAQQVTHCFGELIRKMWSDKRFKSHVDPHMLIQAIAVASRKKYKIGYQAEAGEFMAWLLHQLHIGLGGSDDTRTTSKQKNKKKRKKNNTATIIPEPTTTIIQEIFQGTVQVTTRRNKRNHGKNHNDNENKDDERGGSDTEEEEEEKDMNNENNNHLEETTKDCNFLQLTLDIAEKPLFRDDDGGLVIPQEPLVTVLKKFDGTTFHEKNTSGGLLQQRSRYRLLHPLPKYLILHLTRFKTNQYTRGNNNSTKEKNPTIVAFPVRNLDLSRYVFRREKKKKKKKKQSEEKEKEEVIPTQEQVRSMNVKELKNVLVRYGGSSISNGSNDIFVEKSELVDKVLSVIAKHEQKKKNDNEESSLLFNKYDLVANITHDSPADVSRTSERGIKHDPLQEGSYKCHIQHRGTNQWYEIQDLHVTETMPQLIGLSESYVLIFERKKEERK